MTTAPAAGRFAPSALDPNDVEYIESWDNDPEEGNPPTMQYRNALRADLAPEARSRGLSRCTMCGANLRYVVVMELTTTEELFVVGEDCADNLGLAAKLGTKVVDLRAKASAKRESLKAAHRIEQTYADNPGLEAAVTLGREVGDDFITDVASKMGQGLSVRQIEAVLKAAERIRARQEREAAEALLPTAPVVEGKVTITGTILTFRTQPGYGYNSPDVVKMLVRDDRGFKVWGSEPAALSRDGAKRGDTVTFTATVEASKDDESFGFFKRPTQAKVTARAEEA